MLVAPNSAAGLAANNGVEVPGGLVAAVVPDGVGVLGLQQPGWAGDAAGAANGLACGAGAPSFKQQTAYTTSGSAVMRAYWRNLCILGGLCALPVLLPGHLCAHVTIQSKPSLAAIATHRDLLLAGEQPRDTYRRGRCTKRTKCRLFLFLAERAGCRWRRSERAKRRCRWGRRSDKRWGTGSAKR